MINYRLIELIIEKLKTKICISDFLPLTTYHRLPMNNLSPEKYRHDLEVVRNTAQQVIKDFGMSGIEIIFSGNPDTAYRELVEQVQPALKNLYKQNAGSFMALLYRIDISEKQFRTLAERVSGEDFYKGLAEMVIEREFLKVLTRKIYSNRK